MRVAEYSKYKFILVDNISGKEVEGFITTQSSPTDEELAKAGLVVASDLIRGRLLPDVVRGSSTPNQDKLSDYDLSISRVAIIPIEQSF
jgi:hypothetical protein